MDRLPMKYNRTEVPIGQVPISQKLKRIQHLPVKRIAADVLEKHHGEIIQIIVRMVRPPMMNSKREKTETLIDFVHIDHHGNILTQVTKILPANGHTKHPLWMTRSRGYKNLPGIGLPIRVDLNYRIFLNLKDPNPPPETNHLNQNVGNPQENLRVKAS